MSGIIQNVNILVPHPPIIVGPSNANYC